MKKQKKQINNKNAWAEILVMLPTLFALCIIPFIVLTKDYKTHFTQYIWFNLSEMDQIDSFEYQKGVFVILTGVIALIILGMTEIMAYNKKEKFILKGDKRILALCGIHLFMVFLSSMFSKCPDLAFTGGGYGQWQSMWVLFGYVILFLYTYLFIDSEKQFRILFMCLLVSTALMAAIGVGQRFGHNVLKLDFVQKIITSRSQVTGIDFKEGYSSVIITFNNPNYTGSYVALLFPAALSYVMAKLTKNNMLNFILRTAGILVSIGLLITLSGAGSSAGGISVAVSIVFAAVLLLVPLISRKKKTAETKTAKTKTAKTKTAETKTAKTPKQTKHNYKTTKIAIAAVTAVLIAGFGISRTDFFQQTVDKLFKGGNDTRNLISIINDEKNELTVELRNGLIVHIVPVMDAGQNTSFTAYDEQKKPVPVEWDAQNSAYFLNDSRFSMITLSISRFSVGEDIYGGFRLNDAPNAISWTFMNVDGQWKYYTPFGKFMKLHKVERFGFKNHENMANRRGYIWSRTIPLMKKYWFTGVGPNAFITAFPNDDFVGSKRVGGSTTLVDKPHNTFLHIFIQTGGISVIAYVGLWLLYMFGSLRLFWRRLPKGSMEWLGFGLMISMLSYAICGLTNDTIVGVQNIYWILLGTGYALNRLIKRERECET